VARQIKLRWNRSLCPGLSHSPSGRVPVDAVRTLGPYGPQLDTWAHSSTRKSHTAPARGTPGRSSFKASEIRASFRGKNDVAVTPTEEPTCRIVPSHSSNLTLLAKKELTKSKIVTSVSEHSISTSKSNSLRERAELSIFGSSKQKCKQKEQKEEAKVQKELPVPEVKVVAPEKKQKIAGDGKLKIEDVAPLSPARRTRKFGKYLFSTLRPAIKYLIEIPMPLCILKFGFKRGE
jgi:hypothetical protein